MAESTVERSLEKARWTSGKVTALVYYLHNHCAEHSEAGNFKEMTYNAATATLRSLYNGIGVIKTRKMVGSKWATGSIGVMIVVPTFREKMQWCYRLSILNERGSMVGGITTKYMRSSPPVVQLAGIAESMDMDPGSPSTAMTMTSFENTTDGSSTNNSAFRMQSLGQLAPPIINYYRLNKYTLSIMFSDDDSSVASPSLLPSSSCPSVSTTSTTSYQTGSKHSNGTGMGPDLVTHAKPILVPILVA
ncbi:hypothetical protein BU15DRAFT_66824 [Melanogaster broomeanus]|nr:hypothetical protein BU15DRAFT_66824 [Melanogaster broomeanus]